jgi:hypothetical protein
MNLLGQFSDNVRIMSKWEVSDALSKLSILLTWCERGDSNPHGCPLDPKSSASASSATLAGSKILQRRIKNKFPNSNSRVGNTSD